MAPTDVVQIGENWKEVTTRTDLANPTPCVVGEGYASSLAISAPRVEAGLADSVGDLGGGLPRRFGRAGGWLELGIKQLRNEELSSRSVETRSSAVFSERRRVDPAGLLRCRGL